MFIARTQFHFIQRRHGWYLTQQINNDLKKIFFFFSYVNKMYEWYFQFLDLHIFSIFLMILFIWCYTTAALLHFSLFNFTVFHHYFNSPRIFCFTDILYIRLQAFVLFFLGNYYFTPNALIWCNPDTYLLNFWCNSVIRWINTTVIMQTKHTKIIILCIDEKKQDSF
jgi:hypothetical protein